MLSKQEKILLWGSNIWNFGDGLFGPLFAVFATQIGGNILDITWAWSIYLTATGICTIFIGKFSDKYDKKKIMIGGYALTSIFTFSYLLVSSPVELFFVQAGLGLALAMSNPTWMALYDKYSKEGSDGYIWGLADGEAKILTGIAVLLGGIIANSFSFQALFITMGIVQITATLYQAQILWSKD